MQKAKINSPEFAQRLGEPVSTLVGVKRLVKDGCRVEIEVITVKNKS